MFEDFEDEKELNVFEREAKIKEIRERTEKELFYNLENFYKCGLVRPTGYGKTTLMAQLCKKYKKVLYFYPSDIVKQTVEEKYEEIDNDVVDEEFFYTDDEIKQNAKEMKKLLKNKQFKNVTFMTYTKMIRLSEEEIRAFDYDLICFDEMHRLGAPKTRRVVKRVMEILDGRCHFIGATATPYRSDSFDVLQNFFDNIGVFAFTLHEAIKCGFIKRPYYIYCKGETIDELVKELEEHYTKEIKKSKIDIDREVLRRDIIEYAKLINAERIINDVCHDIVKKDYLKFIVFFDGFSHMKDKYDIVKDWFQKAYSEYSINVLEISSRTKETHDNVALAKNLKYKSKHIDLIYCVDMLNMGYHINDLTGIVMYRQTTSNIIYTQQLGRALSSGANAERCIVFDIVNNINLPSAYDDFVREDFKSVPKRRFEEKMKNYEFDKEQCAWISKIDGTVLQLEENQMIDEDGFVYTKRGKNENPNALHQEDVVRLTAYEADQRDLDRKVTAEQILMCCKTAFSGCVRIFCIENGLKFPIDVKEMAKVNGLTKKKYREYWAEQVRLGRIPFPLDRVRVILTNDNSFDLFCKGVLSSLSVEKVLDMLDY